MDYEFYRAAGLVIGWLLIAAGIIGYFIPDPKIWTVTGEKELMDEKERRSDPRENLRNLERYMLSRKQTREERKTR